MTLEHFEQLVDRLGPTISKWPKNEQTDAAELLRSSDIAKELHASAIRVEELLSSVEQLEPSAALQRRVAEVALRAPSVAESPSFGRWAARFWRPFASVVSFAVLGVVLGWVAPDPAEAAFDEGASELLLELAFSSELVEDPNETE